MKKLLLIGACKNSVHLENYYHLVESFFDEILIVTNTEIDFCESKQLNFSLRNPIAVVQTILKLRKIIKEFSPSVVHVHQANSYAYITTKANGGRFPQIITVWGSDVLRLPNKGFPYSNMVNYSLSKTDFITVDAHFIKDAIPFISSKKVLVANFGIDYQPKEFAAKKNYIYSNRLHKPLYRIESIIMGFKEFLVRNPDWKLIVGANGILTENLKQLAKEHLPMESCEFIGFVDKKENEKRYMESKIWISNPESDGTAISLLEAMGFGCIPVVSDIPANREWISSGENGIIIKDSVTASLEKALSLNLEELQNKNKQLIINKATKEVNRDKFISQYEEIING